MLSATIGRWGVSAFQFLQRLLDLPLAVRAGFQWVAALDLASQKKTDEALKVINAMPERVQQLLSWQVLRLQQYSVAGDAAASEELARKLIPRIAGSRLSAKVKCYLTGYTKWMVGKMTTSDPEFQVDWDNVSLDAPAHWKRRFPLRGHPAWKA